MRSTLTALLGLAFAVAVYGVISVRAARSRSVLLTLIAVALLLAVLPISSFVRHRGDVVLGDVSASCIGVGVGSAVGTGNLDVARIDGEPHDNPPVLEAARRDTLVLQGWAAAENHRDPVRGVCLEVDGRIQTAAVVTFGVERPDVSSAFAAPRLMQSGFLVRFALRGLAPGAHSARIVVLPRTGEANTSAPLQRRLALRIR